MSIFFVNVSSVWSVATRLLVIMLLSYISQAFGDKHYCN